jgi:hypothetical protein
MALLTAPNTAAAAAMLLSAGSGECGQQKFGACTHSSTLWSILMMTNQAAERWVVWRYVTYH